MRLVIHKSNLHIACTPPPRKTQDQTWFTLSLSVNGRQLRIKVGTGGSMTIKVIGGTKTGVVNVGSGLVAHQDDQEIGRRCAFWDSPGILKDVRV